MKTLLTLIFAVVATAMLTSDAHAVATLKLSDGTDTKIVVDDGDGVLSYSGSVGNFSIIMSTGLTKPTVGSVGSPLMELATVRITSSQSGMLEISFSEVGFIPTGGETGVRMGVSGNTTGSISYTAFGETTPGNSLFMNGTGNFDTLTSTPGYFAGESNVNVPALSDSPFSLTQVVTINHGSGDNSSGFISELSIAAVPDGGATVSLLGLTLLSLAAGRRMLRTV